MTYSEAVSRLLQIAEAEIGTHETGDNLTKYAAQYDFDTRLYGFDMNGSPWCDYFVDWCFMRSFGYELGSSMLFQYSGCSGAACEASAQYFISHDAFYHSPQVGDQIFFYVSGGINHTGIVFELDDGYVTTIEGNSGDAVRKNRYRLNDPSIAGYGRPAWNYVAKLSPESAEMADSASDSVSAGSGIISSPPCSVASALIKRGSVGWLVTALQALLNYYGYDLDADGEFGPLTFEALTDFQRRHTDADGDPLEADGICGPKTWAALFSA